MFKSVIVAASLAVAGPCFLFAQSAAPRHLGIFTASTDIGVTRQGSTTFDPASGSYRVTGGGADMWGAADAFHFTWVKVSGDATLTADIHFPGGTLVPLEKAVLIFRHSLDPASPYADVAIHGDGHITLQYRAVAAGPTADTVLPEHAATRLRIARTGNTFTAYAASADGSFSTSGPATTVDLNGPVYVGIGVCAHDANGTATVTFSNVRIDRNTQPPAAAAKP